MERSAIRERRSRISLSLHAGYYNYLRRQPIHRFRQLDVELGHAAGVVGGKRHLDLLVDIEPFRMVIELLGHQRGPRHEPEGLVEIPEYELLGDGIAVLDLAPAHQPGKRGLATFRSQFLSHPQTSS